MSQECCPICSESFSQVIRKQIQCSQCHFLCCRACFRKYLLQSTIDPVCMSCKLPFSYDFMIKSLPTSFWNGEYKEYRKTMLLSREESMLPETQEILIKKKKRDSLTEIEKNLRREIYDLKKEYDRVVSLRVEMDQIIHDESIGRIPINTEIPLFQYFDEDYTPIRDEKNRFVYRRSDHNNDQDNNKTSKTKHSGWVVSCPKEGCNAFLRDKQNRCPICLSEVCTDCLKIRMENEPHQCEDTDKKTVLLLKQNTKSCPSCSTLIYKVSGCDQMWCTNCHTPFSWRTGEMINTVIHNPHYFEYLQRNGQHLNLQNRNVENCGEGLPPISIVFQRCSTSTYSENIQQWIFELYRSIRHVENVVFPRYRVNLSETNVQLRVHYLENRITKDEWKFELYRREKADQKSQQYSQIIQTFLNVTTDWFNRIFIPVIEHNDIPWIRTEIHDLYDFCVYLNEQITLLNKKFKSNLGLFAIRRLNF